MKKHLLTIGLVFLSQFLMSQTVNIAQDFRYGDSTNRLVPQKIMTDGGIRVDMDADELSRHIFFWQIHDYAYSTDLQPEIFESNLLEERRAYEVTMISKGIKEEIEPDAPGEPSGWEEENDPYFWNTMKITKSVELKGMPFSFSATRPYLNIKKPAYDPVPNYPMWIICEFHNPTDCKVEFQNCSFSSSALEFRPFGANVQLSDIRPRSLGASVDGSGKIPTVSGYSIIVPPRKTFQIAVELIIRESVGPDQFSNILGKTLGLRLQAAYIELVGNCQGNAKGVEVNLPLTVAQKIDPSHKDFFYKKSHYGPGEWVPFSITVVNDKGSDLQGEDKILVWERGGEYFEEGSYSDVWAYSPLLINPQKFGGGNSWTLDVKTFKDRKFPKDAEVTFVFFKKIRENIESNQDSHCLPLINHYGTRFVSGSPGAIDHWYFGSTLSPKCLYWEQKSASSVGLKRLIVKLPTTGKWFKCFKRIKRFKLYR
ncbi:MAG: hypothetical protein H6581_23720 [Bacteroidia bacterium]|nr:hypothetical protein [Bacteroidia bacterium]